MSANHRKKTLHIEYMEVDVGFDVVVEEVDDASSSMPVVHSIPKSWLAVNACGSTTVASGENI
jgi:hypothetical protein